MSRSRRIFPGESRTAVLARPPRLPTVNYKGRVAMDHRIAPARPLGRALTAAMAVAGLIGLGLLAAPSAQAQTPPAAKPAAPAKKPAAPAKPAEAAPPAVAPAAPAPAAAAADQPQLMYSPWMKICGKGPDT